MQDGDLPKSRGCRHESGNYQRLVVMALVALFLFFAAREVICWFFKTNCIGDGDVLAAIAELRTEVRAIGHRRP